MQATVYHSWCKKWVRHLRCSIEVNRLGWHFEKWREVSCVLEGFVTQNARALKLLIGYSVLYCMILP